MDILEARKKARKKKKDKIPQKGRRRKKRKEEGVAEEDAGQLMMRRLEEVEEAEVQKELLEAMDLSESSEKKTQKPETGETTQAEIEVHGEVIQDKEEEPAASFTRLAEQALEAVLDKKDERQFLAFSIGQEFFAVDISNIREIIRPRPITPVPGVEEVILGVVSVRGNIMPVVDVALKIGMRDKPYTQQHWDRGTRFVIFAFNRTLVAMVVEDVRGVLSAYESEIEPTPTATKKSAEEYIKGIIRKDNDIFSVINLREVFEFIFERETR